MKLLATLLILAAVPLRAEVVAARYEDPTGRYDHAILGDALEWGALVVETADGRRFRLTLPESSVFEDIAPRVIEVPGETPVVAVIETDLRLGARLALYRETGLVAATPYIGRTHRWLAPIGAADLDGDGALEFAFVDRPHLARTIRIWRYADGALSHRADLAGYTNHRIGEDTIAGGIRDCGSGPEMIVADADWTEIVAVGWNGSQFGVTALGPHRDRASFAAALSCKPVR